MSNPACEVARRDPIEYDIRPLATTAEFERCRRLQEETWGADFSELVSLGILKVTQKMGGILAGAFDERDRMVGFVFGITGFRNGEPAHWSHMLAVTPELRNAGLGRTLKEYQRETLLGVGVKSVYWTFDPLVARNAHFNLNRLGVTVEDYVESMYGDARGTLDAVIGTDRFVVRWDLDGSSSPVVIPNTVECANVGGDSSPLVPDPDNFAGGEDAYVEVPMDIQQLQTSDPELAQLWRRSTRAAFNHLLDSGFRVAGFGREPGTGRSVYALERSVD